MDWLLPLLYLILSLFGWIVLSRLTRRFFIFLRKKTQQDRPIRYRFLSILHIIVQCLYLTTPVIVAFYFFSKEAKLILQRAVGILNTPLFQTEQSRITILTIILIIPIVTISYSFARAIKKSLEEKILPRFISDKQSCATTANIVRYLLVTVFLFWGLSFIGINISSLTLIFGALGIGIGFGLQGTIENIFAGIVLLSTRPIREGDRIEVEKILCDVTYIKLLHTIVTTVQNETLIIPNRYLSTQIIHNQTYDQDSSIFLFHSIQVSYESDLERVAEVLRKILHDSPHTSHATDKPPGVYLYSFDASGITFRMSCRIASVYTRFTALSWINFEIWHRFKTEGISIPFPQLDVHLRGLRDQRTGSKESIHLESSNDLSSGPLDSPGGPSK